MKRTFANRGSILLMVVGLLTIIGMLGATFLVIAHLDAKQSQATVTRSQAGPIPESLIIQLREILKDDLYLDDVEGPYGDYGLAPPWARWRRFIDYPSDVVDKWLASNGYSAPATWAHVTNVDSDADTDNVGITSPGLVDTDGDGIRDAYLYDTGVTNARGERYHVAVRITDLASMLCVNTAGSPLLNPSVPGDTLPPYSCPANIDLREYLKFFDAGTPDYTFYDNVHAARCYYGSQVLNDFNTYAALRLFVPFPFPAPNTPYKPFDIGEEMFLRYLSDDGPGLVGRVYDVTRSGTTPLEPKTRRWLTTLSVSRARVRHPDGAGFSALLKPEFPTGADDGDQRQAKLQAMYDRIKKLLSLWVTPLSVREDAAGCFVANLWAYQTIAGVETDNNSFAFRPQGKNWTAYGMRDPEIFITEAYAKGSRDIGGVLTEVQGIELYNVSGAAVDLTPYKLVTTDGGTISLSGITIGTGTTKNRKFVIYSEQGAPDAAFFSMAPGVNSQKTGPLPATQINFDGGRTVRLVKTIPDKYLGNVDVPIDEIELDYTRPALNGDPDEKDMRRDDVLDDRLYLVAAYKSFSPGRRLGVGNEVAAGDITGADYPVNVVMSHSELANLGELGRVFFCGPIVRDVGSPRLLAFPQRILDAGFKGNFPDGVARGRLDFHPPDVSANGWAASTYPDVPAAAMLNEFFTLVPPDATRLDDVTRIYGRININTATEAVLERLPLPNSFTLTKRDGSTVVCTIDPVARARAARYIVAYRERLDIVQSRVVDPPLPDLSRDYSTRENAAGANIKDLRDHPGHSDINGFLAAGEVAIPLADYANELMGWTDYSVEDENVTKGRNYVDARDAMFRSVGNLVTVNSDVYAANICIQLWEPGKDPATPSDQPKHVWRYLAVIDRSHCNSKADRPAVLMLSEIK